jgi:hypothetical protein
VHDEAGMPIVPVLVASLALGVFVATLRLSPGQG